MIEVLPPSKGSSIKTIVIEDDSLDENSLQSVTELTSNHQVSEKYEKNATSLSQRPDIHSNDLLEKVKNEGEFDFIQKFGFEIINGRISQNLNQREICSLLDTLVQESSKDDLIHIKQNIQNILSNTQFLVDNFIYSNPNEKKSQFVTRSNSITSFIRSLLSNRELHLPALIGLFSFLSTTSFPFDSSFPAEIINQTAYHIIETLRFSTFSIENPCGSRKSSPNKSDGNLNESNHKSNDEINNDLNSKNKTDEFVDESLLYLDMVEAASDDLKPFLLQSMHTIVEITTDSVDRLINLMISSPSLSRDILTSFESFNLNKIDLSRVRKCVLDNVLSAARFCDLPSLIRFLLDTIDSTNSFETLQSLRDSIIISDFNNHDLNHQNGDHDKTMNEIKTKKNNIETNDNHYIISQLRSALQFNQIFSESYITFLLELSQSFDSKRKENLIKSRKNQQHLQIINNNLVVLDIWAIFCLYSTVKYRKAAFRILSLIEPKISNEILVKSFECQEISHGLINHSILDLGQECFSDNDTNISQLGINIISKLFDSSSDPVFLQDIVSVPLTQLVIGSYKNKLKSLTLLETFLSIDSYKLSQFEGLFEGSLLQLANTCSDIFNVDIEDYTRNNFNYFSNFDFFNYSNFTSKKDKNYKNIINLSKLSKNKEYLKNCFQMNEEQFLFIDIYRRLIRIFLQNIIYSLNSHENSILDMDFGASLFIMIQKFITSQKLGNKILGVISEATIFNLYSEFDHINIDSFAQRFYLTHSMLEDDPKCLNLFYSELLNYKRCYNLKNCESDISANDNVEFSKLFLRSRVMNEFLLDFLEQEMKVFILPIRHQSSNIMFSLHKTDYFVDFTKLFINETILDRSQNTNYSQSFVTSKIGTGNNQISSISKTRRINYKRYIPLVFSQSGIHLYFNVKNQLIQQIKDDSNGDQLSKERLYSQKRKEDIENDLTQTEIVSLQSSESDKLSSSIQKENFEESPFTDFSNQIFDMPLHLSQFFNTKLTHSFHNSPSKKGKKIMIKEERNENENKEEEKLKNINHSGHLLSDLENIIILFCARAWLQNLSCIFSHSEPDKSLQRISHQILIEDSIIQLLSRYKQAQKNTITSIQGIFSKTPNPKVLSHPDPSYAYFKNVENSYLLFCPKRLASVLVRAFQSQNLCELRERILLRLVNNFLKHFSIDEEQLFCLIYSHQKDENHINKNSDINVIEFLSKNFLLSLIPNPQSEIQLALLHEIIETINSYYLRLISLEKNFLINSFHLHNEQKTETSDEVDHIENIFIYFENQYKEHFKEKITQNKANRLEVDISVSYVMLLKSIFKLRIQLQQNPSDNGFIIQNDRMSAAIRNITVDLLQLHTPSPVLSLKDVKKVISAYFTHKPPCADAELLLELAEQHLSPQTSTSVLPLILKHCFDAAANLFERQSERLFGYSLNTKKIGSFHKERVKLEHSPVSDTAATLCIGELIKAAKFTYRLLAVVLLINEEISPKICSILSQCVRIFESCSSHHFAVLKDVKEVNPQQLRRFLEVMWKIHSSLQSLVDSARIHSSKGTNSILPKVSLLLAKWSYGAKSLSKIEPQKTQGKVSENDINSIQLPLNHLLNDDFL
ncbi:hypothetical protein TRFO_09110 [Tritrichomonas foetus]|uniref:Uncharacterized protein n=1 Tax=Tritrichomonas foetus TaxID=1144522 RepID=A0A1J4JKA0_9EUKA|nr:hypothetical protein TRFO_09110 [Tritrichomonas foetus]|eukprot:OHS97971.1 hypothetical protein TRFO_09110 [Tritrichomonas foetus]